jgi:hypothetical protein
MRFILVVCLLIDWVFNFDLKTTGAHTLVVFYLLPGHFESEFASS